jgi:hypothetical protein
MAATVAAMAGGTKAIADLRVRLETGPQSLGVA